MSNVVTAVSSWALHRTLGLAYWNSPSQDVFAATQVGPSSLKLLQLPLELKSHGFDRLELCHFHLETKDPIYLAEFKSALKEADVTLQTLLIDDGDISDILTAERDKAWIAGWIDVASELGAEGARVIAGKQPWSKEAFDRSVTNLVSLSTMGTHIRIENWFDLLQTPDQVHQLLDRLIGKVGLCIDLGNWTQPNKYERLEAIAGRAETCHAKCDFVDGATINVEDFSQSLAACEKGGYDGPYVIVYCGLGETDWPAIELQRDFISHWF